MLSPLYFGSPFVKPNYFQHFLRRATNSKQARLEREPSEDSLFISATNRAGRHLAGRQQNSAPYRLSAGTLAAMWSQARSPQSPERQDCWPPFSPFHIKLHRWWNCTILHPGWEDNPPNQNIIISAERAEAHRQYEQSTHALKMSTRIWFVIWVKRSEGLFTGRLTSHIRLLAWSSKKHTCSQIPDTIITPLSIFGSSSAWHKGDWDGAKADRRKQPLQIHSVRKTENDSPLLWRTGLSINRGTTGAFFSLFSCPCFCYTSPSAQICSPLFHFFSITYELNI